MTMIGGANMEGSKSNFAMNAWTTTQAWNVIQGREGRSEDAPSNDCMGVIHISI